MDGKAASDLTQAALQFYREHTCALGAFNSPMSDEDEEQKRVAAFGDVEGSGCPGWHAVTMPCGTGKTTLSRRLDKREFPELGGAPRLHVVDTDAVLSRHKAYPRYMDWMESRVERGPAAANWAQLNSWRDRLLREQLPRERVDSALNVVLVHGRATATALGLKSLGSIALLEEQYGTMLERRRQRFGEMQCAVMAANHDAVVRNDPKVVMCENYQDVEAALTSMLRAAALALAPPPREVRLHEEESPPQTVAAA